MNKLKALRSKELKVIKKILKEGYGFDGKLDYQFFINEKEKVFIVNKDIAGIDLSDVRINSIGLYFGQYRDGKLRLSVEGSFIVGKDASNVVEVDRKQIERWIQGEEIELGRSVVDGLRYDFVIIKRGDDYFGAGKVDRDGRKVFNYYPKARRIKISG